MIEQRTNEWYIQRLGMFTASKFGKLLNTKRGGVGFGDTAMAYIYEVAAERQLKKQFLNGDGFELYLSRTEKNLSRCSGEMITRTWQEKHLKI